MRMDYWRKGVYGTLFPPGFRGGWCWRGCWREVGDNTNTPVCGYPPLRSIFGLLWLCIVTLEYRNNPCNNRNGSPAGGMLFGLSGLLLLIIGIVRILIITPLWFHMLDSHAGSTCWIHMPDPRVSWGVPTYLQLVGSSWCACNVCVPLTHSPPPRVPVYPTPGGQDPWWAVPSVKTGRQL